MKRRVRLTEGDLHRIVKESVKHVLNEMDAFSYDCNDYRDIATTNGVRGFSDVERIYDELKRYLYSNAQDWDFIHATDWTKFINRLRTVPERMRFETSKNNTVSQEVYNKVIEFCKEAQKIPYPDLWVGSNTSFVEKSISVKQSLKYAYRVYDDFINYLISTHEDDDMKRRDIEADWKKFDKTKNDFFGKMKSDAEGEQLNRKYKDYSFSTNLSKNALKRYDIVANPEDENNKELHDIFIGNY